MQLSITFRHIESSEAVKEYAKEKLERIRKYFPDPIKGHVVFSLDGGYQHIADVVITLHNGIVIKGVEATEDLYSSIDLVIVPGVAFAQDEIKIGLAASLTGPYAPYVEVEGARCMADKLNKAGLTDKAPHSCIIKLAAPPPMLYPWKRQVPRRVT